MNGLAPTWGMVIFLALGLAVGCSSGEQDGTAGSDAPPTQTAGPSTDPPVDDPPVGDEPADDPSMDEPPSPEEQAAREAFQTMTTPNVPAEEWNAAHEKLQQIGPPALPVLAEGLKDAEAINREMASTMLAMLGGEAEPLADQMIEALDDPSPFVRANVAAALLQMPDHIDRAVPVLAAYLEGDDVNMRQMAATNLSDVAPEQLRPVLPQLIAALDDESGEVVLFAVRSLGELGPDAAEALPKLQSLQTDDDAELQSALETAIEQIEAEQ